MPLETRRPRKSLWSQATVAIPLISMVPEATIRLATVTIFHPTVLGQGEVRFTFTGVQELNEGLG